MTDRLKGCWVAFNHDVREDDAESLLSAIRLLRGVAGVEPSVTRPEDWMARQRVRHEIANEVLAVVNRITNQGQS